MWKICWIWWYIDYIALDDGIRFPTVWSPTISFLQCPCAPCMIYLHIFTYICPFLSPSHVGKYTIHSHGKWPIYRWFTYKKWWLSMAMLNNQMVTWHVHHIERCQMSLPWLGSKKRTGRSSRWGSQKIAPKATSEPWETHENSCTGKGTTRF